MMEDDADIGIAVCYRLEHIAVLDSEAARESHRLAHEDRSCGLFADKGIQCLDVLTACARLVFAGHDHANARAGKIPRRLEGRSDCRPRPAMRARGSAQRYALLPPR